MGILFDKNNCALRVDADPARPGPARLDKNPAADNIRGAPAACCLSSILEHEIDVKQSLGTLKRTTRHANRNALHFNCFWIHQSSIYSLELQSAISTSRAAISRRRTRTTSSSGIGVQTRQPTPCSKRQLQTSSSSARSAEAAGTMLADSCDSPPSTPCSSQESPTRLRLNNNRQCRRTPEACDNWRTTWCLPSPSVWCRSLLTSRLDVTNFSSEERSTLWRMRRMATSSLHEEQPSATEAQKPSEQLRAVGQSSEEDKRLAKTIKLVDSVVKPRLFPTTIQREQLVRMFATSRVMHDKMVAWLNGDSATRHVLRGKWTSARQRRWINSISTIGRFRRRERR